MHQKQSSNGTWKWDMFTLTVKLHKQLAQQKTTLGRCVQVELFSASESQNI